MAVISGTVKDVNGDPARRVVRAYRRSDGAFASQAVSDATTGAFSCAALDTSAHYALTLDGEVAEYYDPYWSNVVLAMHMDDVGLTDLKGHAVTLTGNAARSATQSKFGGYSAAFDGAGDFLSLAANSDWAFGTGNFTIEAFVFPTTLNKWQSIVGQWSNKFDNGFGLYITNTNTVALLCKSGSTDYSLYTEVAVSLNAWAHVCAFRIGDTAYLAIDGVIRATKTGVQNLSYGNAALGVKVGSALSVVTDYFTGYIDDLRITKGVARYTANFTPPAAAFLHGLSIGAPTTNALIFDNIIPV